MILFLIIVIYSSLLTFHVAFDSYSCLASYFLDIFLPPFFLITFLRLHGFLPFLLSILPPSRIFQIHLIFLLSLFFSFFFSLFFFSFFESIQLSDDEKNDENHISAKYNFNGITILPGETGLLGPIVYDQHSVPSSSEGGDTYKSFQETLYILNSYSGVDKLVLTAYTDLPFIHLKEITVDSSSPTLSHLSQKRGILNSTSSKLSSRPRSKEQERKLNPRVSLYAINSSISFKNGMDVHSQTFHSVLLDSSTRPSREMMHHARSFGSIVEVNVNN